MLELQYTQATVQDAIRLATVLKADSYLGERLRILDLSNNKIMNIGCETIAESLKQNRTLQYLDLGYNKLEDRALYYVAEMLAHN